MIEVTFLNTYMYNRTNLSTLHMAFKKSWLKHSQMNAAGSWCAVEHWHQEPAPTSPQCLSPPWLSPGSPDPAQNASGDGTNNHTIEQRPCYMDRALCYKALYTTVTHLHDCLRRNCNNWPSAEEVWRGGLYETPRVYPHYRCPCTAPGLCHQA